MGFSKLTVCRGLELIVAEVPSCTTDNVTSDELDRFRIYAQYAGAAYCHPFNEGDEVFCNGDICPSMDATYSA